MKTDSPDNRSAPGGSSASPMSPAAATPVASASVNDATGQSLNDRVLRREVTVTAIPGGDSALLPAGITVNIVNRLGGNFTVTSDFGMFRISGANADALGEPPLAAVSPDIGTTDAYGSTGRAEHPGHVGAPDETAVWEQLKLVFDPEIPVNIVDLGLVYSLRIVPAENAVDRYRAEVSMTLTAPGCGMGPVIAEDARNRVLSVPGVHEARVEIVWEPPWTSDMISDDGKMELGLV